MTEEAIKQLAAQIRRLEEARVKEVQALRRASMTAVTVTASILLLVTGFVLVNFVHFRTEFTEEKFAASLERELEELNPKAIAQTQALSEHLLPVYAAEGRKQFQAMMPTIAQKLGEQLDSLGEEMQSDMHTKIVASEKRIRDRTGEIIFAAYPALKATSEREKLTDSFRSITKDSVISSISKFDELFSKDVKQLEMELINFNDKGTDLSTMELQKKFIRLWLQLLDAEIMKL
ncbi:MAG: hypothetical protein ACE5F1_01560 [Planctomycetota bacterium]